MANEGISSHKKYSKLLWEKIRLNLWMLQERVHFVLLAIVCFFAFNWYLNINVVVWKGI